MAALHPKADIGLKCPKRSAYDPERTLICFPLDFVQFRYIPELTQHFVSASNCGYIR
jgi:hypothetical protein